ANQKTRRTRLWSPDKRAWLDGSFPVPIVEVDSTGKRHDGGVRFGVNKTAFAICRNERTAGAWRFSASGQVKWIEVKDALQGLTLRGNPLLTSAGGKDRGVRLRDLDGDGTCELIVGNPSQNAVFRWSDSDRKWQRLDFNLPPETAIVDAAGRDAGLRFIDVNEDGREDVIFSDEARYSLHLFESNKTGWSKEVIAGRRGAGKSDIPMIVRAGTNNGAWFHSKHLWVQNEDTARMPNLVDRRSFAQLLAAREKQAPGKTVSPTDRRRAPGTRPKSGPSRTEGIAPLSPREALASFRLREGMQIELVAAEPLIVDPVAFDWGPDGRLWVVEMHDYPSGIDGRGKPGGRIKVLEDRDGDGRYDRATVFLDGIGFPTGVKVWRKGILVTAAPEIFYAEDTNGDGKADKRKTLYVGFGEGNQQHRVNGLRWGLDNWLYVGNGDSGGRVKSTLTGKVMNVRGRDLKIRPDEGLLDVESGNTQFGINRDDWGNWFGGNNSSPMWHYVLKDIYLRRNTHVAPPNPRVQVSVKPGAAPIFPASRTLERFNDFDRANRFTSACSPMIYRDELLGGPFVGNSFVCEPVHNLVHREIVAPKGYTFTSRRPDDEQKSEFLASTDSWFRPSMVRTGPDGALWISDMYRFVIEHPKWIPQAWQKKLDLRAGDTRGRIYRVYPTGRKPRRPLRLDKLSTSQLVAALDSPNGTQRDLAHQMLLWRGDKSAVAPLKKLLRSAARPQARLHSLCALDGLGAISLDVVLGGLRDPHPGVRRHAVRLSEPFADKSLELLGELRRSAGDADPQVRLQVAYTLGQWREQGSATLGKMLLDAKGDPHLSAAVLSSVHKDNVGGVMVGVLENSKGTPPADVLERLFALATTYRSDAFQYVLEYLIEQGDKGGAAWQFNVAAGMFDALERNKQKLSQARKVEGYIGEAMIAQLDTILKHAHKVTADPKAAEVDRVAAIRILGRDDEKFQADLRLMAGLLVPQTSGKLQQAVVDRMARISDSTVAGLLLAGWRGHGPPVRAAIVETLLRRDDWSKTLVAALEARKVLPNEISARGRQQLLDHGLATVRDRAKKLFAASTSADR
ncbi:MAG: VCBS repeat-containing protein, partial [Planctomycetes bacterium]|nr:VCBS repeat-containing protein [Planctomycetota bacterium]